MHRDLAVLIYTQYVTHKLPMQKVLKMIEDAVKIEKQFVSACLPYDLTGMNKQLMSQYVEFIADKLAYDLVGKNIYYSNNPFPFMNLISLGTKTNFFEKKTSSYSRQAALVDANENTIAFDADF